MLPNTSRIALGARAQFLFLQHFAHFVEQAIPTRSIAQVQPNRQLPLGKLLVAFTAAVLTFFIAGLLYLLRFERVDNLGAYSIRRRPAISSPLVSTS
jgi:hypothetical protein